MLLYSTSVTFRFNSKFFQINLFYDTHSVYGYTYTNSEAFTRMKFAILILLSLIQCSVCEDMPLFMCYQLPKKETKECLKKYGAKGSSGPPGPINDAWQRPGFGQGSPMYGYGQPPPMGFGQYGNGPYGYQPGFGGWPDGNGQFQQPFNQYGYPPMYG